MGRLLNLLQKYVSRNFPGTETDEMIGSHLAIDDAEIQTFDIFYERNESHLGGIADPAEHGFPKKSALPMAMPYSPPTSMSSCHASTEWAYPCR
jgi:hypothetical protein